MQTDLLTLPVRPTLSEKDFSRISQFIQQNFGIQLPIAKRILVESRLVKRISQLNIKSFTDYVNLIFSREGFDEQNKLIDFICTNKTDFFRESAHFRFLETHIKANNIARPIKIWSAACSSGEEPYTTSITLEEMKDSGVFKGTYSILGTDISSTVLNKAIRGEYSDKVNEMVPKHLVSKYFINSNGMSIIKAGVRKNISFKKFNLIDPLSYNTIDSTFDFIFCRNVLIYFDRATQIKVIENLVKKLGPEGILFLGHTETLLGHAFPLIQLQPSIYRKTNA